MGVLGGGGGNGNNKSFKLVRLRFYFVVAFASLCGLYIMCFSSPGEAVRSIYSASDIAASISSKLRSYSLRRTATNPFYLLPSADRAGKIINFPPLRGKSWTDLIKNKELPRREKLAILTEAMQSHLEHFQGNASCTGYTLHCGHSDSCGLGCQLHHHAVCVLISYTMGIPLIHDAVTGWPSDTPWEDVYRKLGSSCKENEKTIYFRFQYIENVPPTLHLDKFCNLTSLESCQFQKRFEFPLTNGVPIPKDLYQIVKANHDDPFLWYVGQFVKYATRYSPKMEQLIKETETAMGFKESKHVVGIHIRRTDKIFEYKNSHHELREYMNWTKAYFQTTYSSDFWPRALYLASDDHLVIREAQISYTAPLWKVLSLNSNQTFKDQGERRSDIALKTIVQDIHFLVNCEYVICGTTSNVCRLLLELLATKYSDIWTRHKSVDGSYDLVLLGATPPKLLIPV